MKPLSAREVTCLGWAAMGKTSWEIGVILGLTERTVNFHIQNACGKLHVHGRQAAITVAIQAGLLPQLDEEASGLRKTRAPRRRETRQPTTSQQPRPAHQAAAKLQP